MGLSFLSLKIVQAVVLAVEEEKQHILQKFGI